MSLGESVATPVELEIHLWAVQPGTLATALAGLDSRPQSVDEHTWSAWRDVGLRVLPIQSDELAELETSLLRSAPPQTHRMSARPVWSPLLSGDVSPRPFPVRMPDGVLELSPGSVRLLMRSWAVTGLHGSDGRLRVQLVPQHAPDRSARERFRAQLLGQTGTVADRGLVLRELHLDATLDIGCGLLLVAASPDEDWLEVRDQADRRERLVYKPTPEDLPAAGPVVPAPPALGQRVLDRNGAKTLVLLMPVSP